MVHTKKNDLKDGAGAVFPPPQPPQLPSPSQFIAAASAIRSTAARVTVAATSALTSPSKSNAITASAGIAITSPGKGTDTDANAGIVPPTPRSLCALKGRGISIANNVPAVNAPHHNAFMVDPNLEGMDYEDKDIDRDKEEEYEDLDFDDGRDFSQDNVFY
jgi:hypothetical protein